jgi:hypothetical protein
MAIKDLELAISKPYLKVLKLNKKNVEISKKKNISFLKNACHTYNIFLKIR